MSSPYSLHTSSSADRHAAADQEWPVFNSETGFEVDLEDDHPELYLSATMCDRMAHDATLSEHDKMVIQRLACRKFHVPGNTFWEDYRFWFHNNHPFLCFCFADPRHPLGRRERVLNLLSSLAFGLAATCSVVLWFYYEEDRNFDNVAFSCLGYYDVTVGMLALLLFSGPLHVMFDLGLFFLQACPPCRTGGLFERWPALSKVGLWAGAHLAFLITTASLSLAILVMIIRASIAENDGNDENVATDPKHYSFLLLYLLEVFLANFVVFPMGTFTVFSGVLGCNGRLPGIGGRPYQVRKHQALVKRQRRKNQKDQPSQAHTHHSMAAV